MAGELRFAELEKLLEAAGYRVTRIKGSHHIFTKPGLPSFSVPVHQGKVLPVYVRQARKRVADAAREAKEEEKADDKKDDPKE